MAKSLTDRSVGFLILAVFLVLVVNCLITFISLTKVKNEKKHFQLTETFFRKAILEGVSNYLYSVTYDLPTNQVSKALSTPKCKIIFLDDLVVYYRHYAKRWQARFNGCDFVVGDYFEDGFIVRIAEGRVYVHSDDNQLVIYRPRVAASPASPGDRPAGDNAPL